VVIVVVVVVNSHTIAHVYDTLQCHCTASGSECYYTCTDWSRPTIDDPIYTYIYT